MLLQILLASILTLNFGNATTVTPVVEDSHGEASNNKITKIDHDYSPGISLPNAASAVIQQVNDNARHSEDGPRAIWDYQPFIEYSNISPHSKSITQIAFGKEAVEALQKSKEPQQQQTNANILYLQSEVAKPVDNQLHSQPELKPNLVYVGPGPDYIKDPEQNVFYLTHENVGQSHTSSGIEPEQLLYYSQVPQLPQVPQQLHPVQHNENVVYITPQPQQQHNNYGPPIQPNYYQPNHVYLVANQGIDISVPQPTDASNPEQKHLKPKNVVVDHINKEKTKGKTDKKKDDKHNEEHDKTMHDEKEEHTLVESNTAKAIIEEYERHYIKRRKNVDVKVAGETGTTPSPYRSATTPFSITKPGPLSRQPIIVADLDENNLEFSDDKTYSTTQSTIKTVKTSSSLYHATQPLIVTQRPLATTFLAPITAGVQLQPITTSNGKPNNDVVVEIQKSVPYYLGKFEFVQNDDKPTKNEEINQNVNLGANLLKYSIERLPNPQAFISEFNQSGPQILTQLTYSTLHSSNHDQEQESGQFDYKVQDAPYHHGLVQNSPKQNVEEVTKLKKVPDQEELPQPVVVQDQYQIHAQTQSQHQSPQIQVRELFVPPPHIAPVKTISDYVQKQQPLQLHQQHIPPIISPHQPQYNQQPILLEPYAHVTKLVPQYLPLKHHQEVQKVPMKTYSYAPSYQTSQYHNHHQPHHLQHNIQHNYQISHGYAGNKKPKNLPANHPHVRLGSNFFHSAKFNNYIGMKPPKITSAPIQSTHQQTNQPTPSATNQHTSLNGPPFKASQHLQTIHEYLPATHLTDQQVRKYRNPRHSFESSIRLEYGFMPPLIPSIEIDEFGKPIAKSEE